MSARWQIPEYREIAIVEDDALASIRSDWSYTIIQKSSKPLKLPVSLVATPAEYSERFGRSREGRGWIRMSLDGLVGDRLFDRGATRFNC